MIPSKYVYQFGGNTLGKAIDAMGVVFFILKIGIMRCFG